MAVLGHPRSLIFYQSKACVQLTLVISSNLGPILLRFRDIAGFYAQNSHPNFGDIPLGLDCRC